MFDVGFVFNIDSKKYPLVNKNPSNLQNETNELTPSQKTLRHHKQVQFNPRQKLAIAALTKYGSWTNYYTQKTKNIVFKQFEKDFDVWNYDKNFS